MPASKSLSVIIPAYNKDTEVAAVISSYVDLLKKTSHDWEIIVVDDASSDHTLKEAIRSKNLNGNSYRIKIYSYDLNQGKGFALYYGFGKSTGQTVVFADSDLDLPAQNLQTLLAYLESASADIAIGSKRHKLSKVNYPTVRRIQSKVYQLLTKVLFNLNVTDTQAGLKAFKRSVLADCLSRIVVKRFAFDVELLVVARKLGYRKLVEVPVELNYHFTSTISLKCVKDVLQDTLAIYWRRNILKYYDWPHYRLVDDEATITAQKAFV